MKLYFILALLLSLSVEVCAQSMPTSKKRIELQKVSSPKPSNVDETILAKKVLKDLEFKLNYIKNNSPLYDEAIDKGWVEEMEKAIELQKERLKVLQKLS